MCFFFSRLDIDRTRDMTCQCVLFTGVYCFLTNNPKGEHKVRHKRFIKSG